MSRHLARLTAVPPWAAVALVLVVGASTWWAIASCRAPAVARPEAPPVAEEPAGPSARKPIPEVREPTPLERALALLERARELARDGRRHDALDAYGKAEDALRSLLDEAMERRASGDLVRLEPICQQCIVESDEIAYALFTPEVVAATPWRDLLAPPVAQVAHDGFARFEVGDRWIHAVGPAQGSTRDGIFSIGDLERWRDFVLEIEFTPIRGVSRFYWRLGRIVNDAPDELTIGEADGAWHHGETYVVTATYIGSRRLFEYSPNTQSDPDYVPGIGWRNTRVGAFGAVLSQASELHVSGLRLKLLR